MYVFYPASRVVGLTCDHREFSQISPFPVKSFSVEPETERNREPAAEEGNLTAIAPGSNNRDSKSDCFPRRSPSPRSKTAKSQSESPVLAANKNKKKKKSGGNSRVTSAAKSPEEIKLGQHLKNLEIYFATKPRSLRRTWSRHFKKVDEGPIVPKMSGSECALREMTHPALNETLRAHNAVTFRLVKTVSEFTESLARIHEQHAEQMQLLVSSFRKKNAEFRKEKPASTSTLFHSWETFLQEVEVDSQAHLDIAGVLGRQISRPLLEKSFFRKIQSRKVFSHRNIYENLIEDAEEKLGKTRLDYKTAYLAYMNGASSQSLAKYIACHNEYVSQLHLTNGMLAQYHSDTLPSMLQEIEDIYNDLCVKVSDSILQVAEMISSRAQDQAKRYNNLTNQCRSVQGPTDLGHLARSITLPGNNPPAKRPFAAPQPPPTHVDGQATDPAVAPNVPPSLKNEIVLDRLTNSQVRDKIESAKKESSELETQSKHLSDALHTLARIQQRSIDSNLFNKVNELQEEISMKQQELNVALIRLAGLKAQKELFSNKAESAETSRERKMSSSSTGSMKSKWMKAFKSLKTPPANGGANKDGDKKNQMYHAVSTIIAMRKNGRDGTTSFSLDTSAHAFQDYTYKKITPCDVCSQVLRGHTRQGLKCRVCKVNVHVDCQEKAPKCQQKSRLLRRQKSTSEIDTKIQDPPLEEENCEVDKVYQVLKQASDLSSKVPGSGSRNHSEAVFSVPNASPPSARGDFYLEKTCSFERKTDLYYPNPKIQKSYSRLEYQSPEFHQQHPLPKSYKNRLSDPGVIHLNNAACLGPSSAAGTASSGPAGVDSATQPRRQQGPLLLRGSAPHGLGPVPFATNSAPHSPRKQKLNLRMKSLSLDSPESTEHAQKRRAQALCSAGHSSQSSSSKLQSPSSPVHSRRLLSARNVRMSSVDLPDDNERSLSSASTSPCPSPKPHRLLPTNLYVVLYNFKSRHPDELDLKAGYKVTVMDGSDPDWWKGKCLGRVGFFPSKYVIKLEPGERPLQVTHNLQVQDGDSGIMLLRDQIVIQVGEDIDGMVMIRSADNKQGPCPLKFLQEV